MEELKSFTQNKLMISEGISATELLLATDTEEGDIPEHDDSLEEDYEDESL